MKSNLRSGCGGRCRELDERKWLEVAALPGMTRWALVYMRKIDLEVGFLNDEFSQLFQCENWG